ncbi:LOW QUALITY PROTEIN: hypothetical protein OSB04_025256 [Centaurea solstitialis]|uniref:Uncharacterized protein n=1 Tax=Centaurea solstitialis TaxID=347529 RepID=A0AA38SMS2_9ASTR|nr:LOW QUALITY PROTEIN: hypothetical protein OSB04_025256 [Centaurea solstitialis]
MTLHVERPIAVLEMKNKILRNKDLDRVQWGHRKGSEWTMEPEAEFRAGIRSCSKLERFRGRNLNKWGRVVTPHFPKKIEGEGCVLQGRLVLLKAQSSVWGEIDHRGIVVIAFLTHGSSGLDKGRDWLEAPIVSMAQFGLDFYDFRCQGYLSYLPLNIFVKTQILVLSCYITILEENYKDQVSVNQTLCIEREKALAAKERALAELNAEKVTIKGWSDASEKVDEILASGRNVKNKKGLGFTRGCPRPDRSMLKFGMFVSSIPDPNAPENIPSSSNTHTEGAPKSKKKSVKENSKTVPPSKTKNPKPKKNKVLGGGPSVSGSKSFSQNPTPRLKIDLKQKTMVKRPIPRLSNVKGILGAGPAHLKFKDFLDPTKRSIYRKCYHCGLNDHIASNSPHATKAEKSAKVKKNPKTSKTVKGKKVVKTVSSVKTPAPKTDNSVKAVTDSDFITF